MMPESREAVWFRRTCRMVACFPLVLGGTIALSGTAGFEVMFGVEVGIVDSTFESGVRFLATTFLGMGLVLWWASADFFGRSGAVQIFFVAMVFGALARLIGIRVHGTPNLMSLVLIGIELTGAPMLLWHRRLLGQRK